MRALVVAAVCLWTLSFAGCGPVQSGQQPAPISAAASTAELVEELCALYAQKAGVRFPVDAASSSTLARQIEQGKPFSIYLSAHSRWVEYLLERGVGDPDSRRDWLRNELVWVRYQGAELELGTGPSLPSDWTGRLCIGDPDHVPAGIYAKQALQHHGLWEHFAPRSEREDAPVLVSAPDVSAALRHASSGQCDAAIVYASDVRNAAEVVVLHRFSSESHEPIRYPLLLPKDASPAVRAFAEWLGSEQVREIVLRHGFELTNT